MPNMMRKSDQLAYALAEDLDRRKVERSAKLYEETDAAIKAVAEAGKFDLILQQATYARPGDRHYGPGAEGNGEAGRRQALSNA